MAPIDCLAYNAWKAKAQFEHAIRPDEKQWPKATHAGSQTRIDTRKAHFKAPTIHQSRKQATAKQTSHKGALEPSTPTKSHRALKCYAQSHCPFGILTNT